MKKVAIVGVEGSGKTVLMAAMGDAYKSPKADGIFLRPENRETYAYYTTKAKALHSGKWPEATTPDTVLDLEWVVARRKKDDEAPQEICHLLFLDYGGEAYRLAFGGGRTTERHEMYKGAISSLRSYVNDADILVVLVNLSDIINGDDESESTIETKWLSQAILSQAFEQGTRKKVALVFTQANTYSNTIAAIGGMDKVLERLLPEVYANYSKRLPLFAVTAVNKVVPANDGSGLPVPATDFSSEGLGDLVKWISREAERIKGTPSKQIDADGKKRHGFFYYVWRLLLFFVYISVLIIGYVFSWEILYDDWWYLNFTERGRVRNVAAKISKALDYSDFEKFKSYVAYPDFANLPQSIVDSFESGSELLRSEILAKRGKFWNDCKGFDCYWYRLVYHIEPVFKARLWGMPCYIFKVEEDYWRSDKREIMIAVGMIDNEWKAIDFAWHGERR